MTDAPEPVSRPHDVVRDLVAYVIVEVPAEDALAAIVPALADLVDTAKVRILDLVVVVKDATGVVTVREYETVESIAALRDVEGEIGGLLTERDIELASSRCSRPPRAWSS